jgi:lipopolysaccharide biosynthesis glycosyltransferase
VAAYAKLEKIKAIRDSPYEVTLYLDCDTVVLQPIGELFKKVSEYDMLIANSPHLDTSTKPYKLVALAKPNAYNSGVIVYQKNERTRQLFKDWLSLSSVDKNRLMKVRENFYDQPKLVKLLNSKNSQIKLKVIPNVIYNARHTMILRLKKQHLYSKVKIIHTHTPNK